MKIIKYTLRLCLIALTIISCTEDDNTDYVKSIAAPTNVSAAVRVTQDNTGLVTITPLGEGVVSFTVNFGDGSEISQPINSGKSLEHVYAEGTYEAIIVATGLNGLTTTAVQNIVVSFKAPENLVVIIENDPAISKQVNVTATADFALSYEVYFGEPGNDEPIVGNNGDTVSYQYQQAGTYTIRVVSMSAAVETTEYSEAFLVTAILQPLAPAPTPTKAQSDVVSIYSDSYTDPDPIDYYPNWGQTTTYTQIAVNGNNMIQYGGLTYQGIDFNTVPVDASAMEYLHVDIWTADAFDAKISPISPGPNEAAYDLILTADQWNSFDIPISYFTDLNASLDFSSIFQFKFDGVPSGAGTIFVDNLYFYRSPAEALEFPIDFESTTINYAWVGFGDPNFGPIPVAVITNPDQSGINTSATVVEIQKQTNSQVWAGASMNLSGPVDFTNGTTVTMKVWSPRAGVPILFKMEDTNSAPDNNGNPSVFVEVQATTTGANTWEELSFDLTSFGTFSTSINYYNVIIFPDFGNPGAGETFYFDDLALTGGSLTPTLPVDFESSTLEYTWVGFGDPNFGPIPVSVITNPDQTGVNISATVLEIQKPTNSQVWAGASMNLAGAVDFSNGTTIKLKVWSPRSGVPVLFKMEDTNSAPDNNGNPSVFVEVQATTTVANSWEELSFDLTSFGTFSTSISYYNVIIFPDFGSAGAGETFYFDDIILTN